ncbi:MAG: hypothetical protein GX262_01775 [Clostridia bacterium]|nr:hypothetical protein [Clostridia bacterium]
MDLVATQVNMLTMDMGEIKQKLDQKSDKSDIIRLENTIIPKTKAVFNGYAQHSDQLRRHELILQKIK